MNQAENQHSDHDSEGAQLRITHRRRNSGERPQYQEKKCRKRIVIEIHPHLGKGADGGELETVGLVAPEGTGMHSEDDVQTDDEERADECDASGNLRNRNLLQYFKHRFEADRAQREG